MPRSRMVGAQPHGEAPVQQDIAMLEELLASGWQIEPPVLVRPAWAQGRSGSVDYHFILTNDRRRSLVVLVDSAEVRLFLAQHALTV
ncbi:MAG: hypothetical protein OHK0022_35350 [Roseiflexaceae bacterium]